MVFHSQEVGHEDGILQVRPRCPVDGSRKGVEIGFEFLGDGCDNGAVQAPTQRDSTHAVHSLFHRFNEEFPENPGRIIQVLRLGKVVDVSVERLQSLLGAVNVSGRKFLDIEFHMIHEALHFRAEIKNTIVGAVKERSGAHMIPGENHFIVFFHHGTAEASVQSGKAILFILLIELPEEIHIVDPFRSFIEEFPVEEDVRVLLKGGAVSPLGDQIEFIGPNRTPIVKKGAHNGVIRTPVSHEIEHLS